MRFAPLVTGFILTCLATGSGCQPGEETRPQVTRSATLSPASPIAYVAGSAITRQDLHPLLIEAAGGVTLYEAVLDELIRQRLKREGLTVGPTQVQGEKRIILDSLAPGDDEATRLLEDLRDRRGLGEQRFAALLNRNAGLRQLVAGKVEVGDAAVEQAYRLTYGPAVRARLLLTENLAELEPLRRMIAEGESFGEVAAMHSTDPSAASGGLLPPIRPDDQSFPRAIRTAAQALQVGEVSDPIALDGGYALVKIETLLPGREVDLDAVRDELRKQVRRRAERVLMQQLAREMISGAEVVVLDPRLKAGWDRQRQGLIGR